ncbi:hypothetical protein LIER_43766 [Lithospermum erythrorhizon]|uniref:DUF4283 domain-containing protein n=1 Tax=Lithospermum erythrorhizon TaxID=34254 RepID=A0AAV3QU68_LITER
MRVFKWDCAFSPQKESAIAPVWIRLEGVPLYLFDEASLLSIANAIGKPLRVHPSNLNRVKLNSAQVCVELNVEEPRPDAIWVCFEDDFSKNPVDGFWIRVYYDAIPPFCTECFHIGHRLEWCKQRKTSMNSVGKVFDYMPQPALNENSGVNFAHHMFDNFPQSINTVGKVFDNMSQPALNGNSDVHHMFDKLPQQTLIAKEESTKEIATMEIRQIMGTAEATSKGVISPHKDHLLQGNDQVLAPEIGKTVRTTYTGASATHPGDFLEANSGTDFTGRLEGSGLQQGNEPVPLLEQQIMGSKTAQTGKLTAIEPTLKLSRDMVPRCAEVYVGGGKGNTSEVEEVQSSDDHTVLQNSSNQQGAINTAELQVMKHGGQVLDMAENGSLEASLTEASFTTPDTSKIFPRARTPPSWADFVEEEEPLPQIITQLDATQVTDYAKKQIETIMQDPIATKKNPVKAKKRMCTDLPIQAEPLIEVDNGKMVKLSQLPYDQKLCYTRSVSPHGRSSEKLKSLRLKLNTIDYYSGRGCIFELVSEEPAQAEKIEGTSQAKGSRQHQYPPSPGQSRSRRNRGRNRYR